MTTNLCIDCRSANVSEPDHEGFIDCFDCGAAWIPGRTAPSDTPDPFIAACADSARTMARQVLDWELDRLRLDLGMVEVVSREETDVPLVRYTRHLLKPENREGNVRFLPFSDGTGVLIRDRVTP